VASLVPLQSVVVRFGGARAVTGPMTLGQLNIYKWLGSFTTATYGMQVWHLSARQGLSVTDVAEALGVLVTRHEGLRTFYLPDHRQRVVDSGELLLRVLEPDSDMAALEPALDAVVKALPYEPMRDLPVRAAVAIEGGQVRAGVLSCSHLAADHKAMLVLGREFEEMLADPAARTAGPRRHQPVDQSAAEQAASMRRRADNSLSYWTGRLRRMPANPLAGPLKDGQQLSGALEMVSHAAAVALPRIERRTSLDRPTLVLAAVLAVLSEWTGDPSHVFCALSSNRFFDRRLTDYVGTLASSSLVEVDRWATFDELGEEVRAGMMRGSLNGLYDAYRLHALAQRIECERGISFNYFPPIFNNAAHYFRSRAGGPSRSTPLDVRPTELSWRPMEPTPAPLRFDLWRTDDVLVLDGWTGNTGRIGRDDVRAMLLAVERLLSAAADGDLDRRQASAIIDLPRRERGEGWLLVDSCWVDLAETQRLLDDALAPACTRIYGEVDGRPLVAYLAATDSVRTPEQAHARCMSRLPDYPVAMAPRWYVVCDQAPAEPHDLPAWQRQHVIAHGPGRHGPNGARVAVRVCAPNLSQYGFSGPA
jgi:hypothetical protein